MKNTRNKPVRILFWDLETSPIVANTWNLWPQSISHESIVSDWSIICGCWNFLGEETIHSVAIDKPGNDKAVVKRLRDVVASADVIVHHYGDAFDLKKLNARIIYYGFEPLPVIPTVDTKKMAKKVAAFSSNKLDYLSKYLLGKGKIHVDYELWLKVMAGSKAALREMVAYNKVDVKRLKEIYLRLLPYMKNHPHIGAIAGKDRDCSCPNCGSSNVKKNGTKYTAAGVKKQEIQCSDCHKYSNVKLK